MNHFTPRTFQALLNDSEGRRTAQNAQERTETGARRPADPWLTLETRERLCEEREQGLNAWEAALLTRSYLAFLVGMGSGGFLVWWLMK